MYVVNKPFYSIRIQEIHKIYDNINYNNNRKIDTLSKFNIIVFVKGAKVTKYLIEKLLLRYQLYH